MAENTLSLNKTFVLFGLALCALIAVAVVATMPPFGRLEAHERTARMPCQTVEVPLDEGYGVSRVAQRRVCGDE